MRGLLYSHNLTSPTLDGWSSSQPWPAIFAPRMSSAGDVDAEVLDSALGTTIHI